MSAVVEMLVPAVAVSGLMLACLALLPQAPPRVRFWIAVAGLAAWAVPWPSLDIPLPLPRAAGDAQVLDAFESLALLAAWPPGNVRPAAHASAYFGYAAAALFLPGFCWFVRDSFALCRAVRRLRGTSRSGESLRRLLPAPLRNTRAEIRIVEGTRLAAASGWIRPTVWVGSELSASELRLALVHELWHVRSRDPLRITLVLAVRRAYWWNPIVACLASQAVLMIESACDHRCTESLGRRPYVRRLAAMMLSAQSTKSPLAAAMQSSNLNVQRLRLLECEVRLRKRDGGLIAMFATAAAVVGVSQIVASPGAASPGFTSGAASPGAASPGFTSGAASPGAASPGAASPGFATGAASPGAASAHVTSADVTSPGLRPPWSRVTIPATPAGRALTKLLDAYNAGDVELTRAYLGAYTPQEVELPSFDFATGLRLVEVLRSEPLRIEYVVEDEAGSARRVGTLEVAASID